MSQPKRYIVISLPPVIQEDEQGYFVSWDDYAALAAENERLRKAGDRLAFHAQEDGTGWELHDAAKAWLAAKEGKKLTKHEDDIRRGLRTK